MYAALYVAGLLLAAPAAVPSLAADEWSDREAAQATLKAAGPLAWPLLVDARHSTDPEVLHRIRPLLAKHDRIAADSATLRKWLDHDLKPAEAFELLYDAAEVERLSDACDRLGINYHVNELDGEGHYYGYLSLRDLSIYDEPAAGVFLLAKLRAAYVEKTAR